MHAIEHCLSIECEPLQMADYTLTALEHKHVNVVEFPDDKVNYLGCDIKLLKKVKIFFIRNVVNAAGL